jgi:hypothetical protein
VRVAPTIPSIGIPGVASLPKSAATERYPCHALGAFDQQWPARWNSAPAPPLQTVSSLELAVVVSVPDLLHQSAHL